MFNKADLVLITKTDLLPYLPEISVDRIRDSLARVMPNPKAIEISAKSGVALNTWIDWLLFQERGVAPGPRAVAT
jgi:hydrogenase nickel incorporation protein HypB